MCFGWGMRRNLLFHPFCSEAELISAVPASTPMFAKSLTSTDIIFLDSFRYWVIWYLDWLVRHNVTAHSQEFVYPGTQIPIRECTPSCTINSLPALKWVSSPFQKKMKRRTYTLTLPNPTPSIPAAFTFISNELSVPMQPVHRCGDLKFPLLFPFFL